MIKAISSKDFELFGCPHCGAPKVFGNNAISLGRDFVYWYCNNEGCGNAFVVLVDGVTRARVFLFGVDPFEVELEAHPLAGEQNISVAPKVLQENPNDYAVPPAHEMPRANGEVSRRAFLSLEWLSARIVEAYRTAHAS